MSLLQIAIKLIIGFVGLWVITRLLGKKEISQLTPFDFVSALMLSELVGNTIYSGEADYGQLGFSLVFWMLLSYIMDLLVYRCGKLRKTLEGEPALLIVNGEVSHQALRRNRIDMNQLSMMLRQRDVFSLNEVAYAVLENNGSLSVLLKPEYEVPSRGDLKLMKGRSRIPTVIMEDGQVLKEGLERIRRNERWLRQQMLAQTGLTPEQALYVEWTEDTGLYVVQKMGSSGKVKHQEPG
ncbi:DUF421 domain-containing protein [Paenibacillus filicis]|uniref:DUF421 domain-containing protein n=1 Tax=Paenibacillus filicis TaxID=669464 RepID=A0ABU9DU52_9BACL